MAKTIEAGSLAQVFADQAATYTKVVAGFTVPVTPSFREGDPMTALQARALSTYKLDRAASVANSNAERGTWSKLPDAEKLAKVAEYVKTYDFSNDIGGEVFGMSLLEKAADRVIAEAFADKFANLGEAEARQARAPNVAKMLNSPELTEKYRDRIEAAMSAIMAERHEKRARGEKAKADIGELEL